MKAGWPSSVGLFALKIANVGLTFGTTVLLTRWLGADGFGTFSLVLAAVGLINVPVAQGIGNLLVRESARAVARDAWADLKGLFLRGHQAALAVGATAILVALAVLGLSGGRLYEMTWVVVAIGGGIVVADSFSGLRAATIRGLGYPFRGQLPDQLLKPLGFALAVLALRYLFQAEPSPTYAVGAFAAGSALGLGIGWGMLAWLAPKEIGSTTAAFHDRVWGRAALAFGGASALVVLNGYTDLFILSSVAPRSEVGVYRVAYQMATVVSLFYMSINLVVAPRFAYLKTRGEADELRSVAVNAARGAVAAALPIPVAMIFIGPWLLGTVFGDEFAGAYVPMLILMGGQVFNSGVGFVASLLTMTGRENRVLAWAGVGVTLNAILSFLLAPKLGAPGAAVASAVGSVAWNAGLWYSVWKIHGFDASALGLPPRRTQPLDIG